MSNYTFGLSFEGPGGTRYEGQLVLDRQVQLPLPFYLLKKGGVTSRYGAGVLYI